MTLLRLAAALAPLAAAACGHIPLTSLPKLARIDVMSTDPALIRAALRTPGYLQPSEQRTVMTVTMKVGDDAPAIHRLALQRIEDPVEVGALAAFQQSGRRLFAFRLMAADAQRLSDIRKQALARKSEGKPGSLTIAINPETCRIGELPPGPVLVDSYLKTSELSDYVTLTRNVDLRNVEGKDVAALIPPCDQRSASTPLGKSEARRPSNAALSSAVDAGSRDETATKQEIEPRF